MLLMMKAPMEMVPAAIVGTVSSSVQRQPAIQATTNSIELSVSRTVETVHICHACRGSIGKILK